MDTATYLYVGDNRLSTWLVMTESMLAGRDGNVGIEIFLWRGKGLGRCCGVVDCAYCTPGLSSSGGWPIGRVGAYLRCGFLTFNIIFVGPHEEGGQAVMWWVSRYLSQVVSKQVGGR